MKQLFDTILNNIINGNRNDAYEQLKNLNFGDTWLFIDYVSDSLRDTVELKNVLTLINNRR